MNYRFINNNTAFVSFLFFHLHRHLLGWHYDTWIIKQFNLHKIKFEIITGVWLIRLNF